MAIKEYKRTDDSKLSENFKVSEFACKCGCSTVKIDEKLVTYLQKIRDHFGVPITINSGYRCDTHNKKVGGASGSRHTKGQACDIVVKGIKPKEVAKYAESIGILGVGLYETDKDGYFVHVDTRTTKSFWYGQKNEKRVTFGGAFVKVTVKEWQEAAIADGFAFPKYGADGKWGAECEAVAKKAVCKKRIIYKNKNLTKLVQRVVGVTVDGKFGNATKNALMGYQKLHGLEDDGECGINTWRCILGIK